MKGFLAKLQTISLGAVLVVLGTQANATAHAQVSKQLFELDQSAASWRTIVVKSGDSLEKIFKDIGLDISQLQEILSTNRTTNKALNNIKPGQTMKLQATPNHQLLQLKYALNDEKMLWVQRAAAGFKTVVKESAKDIPLPEAINSKRPHYISGTIQHSLNETASRSGMSYNMTHQLTQAFSNRVNFKRLQAGDHFSFIYQPSIKDPRNGEIIAAEFNNRGKDYQVVRYTDASGHTAYYDPKGQNFLSTSGFLRFPVQFKRISSPFSYKRMDPVVHRVHSHLGVDLAAAYGTPIKSIGDGKIEFMGRRGGYGNAIIVSYGNNYKALFGHLSRFNTSLKRNSPVHQGQVIGYVGSTGWATGSHLHYELHVNGVPRDPVRVALPAARSIQAKDRSRFLQQSKAMLAQLELFQNHEFAANNHNRHDS